MVISDKKKISFLVNNSVSTLDIKMGVSYAQEAPFAIEILILNAVDGKL